MTTNSNHVHSARPLPLWRSEFERAYLWNPAAIRSSTPERHYRIARSNLTDD